MDEAGRDTAIQIMSLEYQTLRDEIMVQTNGRFQFLGLMTTAAALLTSGFFGGGPLKGHVWISAGLAIPVFAFGLICFWLLGRQVVSLSARVAEIEQKTNAILPADVSSYCGLAWESMHQHRSRFERIAMGLTPARRQL